MTGQRSGPDEFDEPFDRRLFLTRREVAERFGRTERTIKNWEDAGRLHAKRVGRSVFYRRAEVDGLTEDDE